MKSDVKPIAMSGIHDKFFPFFTELVRGKKRKDIQVLDAGSGHGALAKRLYEEGFCVSACDLFPEIFGYDKVVCKKADFTESLPYDDNSFDFIIAVEVIEHLSSHSSFFHECNRILREKGKLVISTPNILSLKSRFRFLLSGFFYSFGPLDMDNEDGLQHILSITLDQFHYIARRAGFAVSKVSVDKYQSTSILFLWILPFLYLYTKLAKINFKVHNTLDVLLGRILFIVFEK